MQRTFLIVAQEILADQRISANAKLLLAQLLDHRNKRTGQCNPWETSLAEELGISRCTVMRGLKELSLAGWIQTKRTQNGNQYKFPKSQNATSQVANPNMESRKSALGTPPHPYMNLNNEPYKEPQYDADDVRLCTIAPSSPPAAAAACPDNKSLHPNTNTLARALANELIAGHPQPGLPGKAFELIRKLLAQSVNPEETAATVRRNHSAWVTYWSALYRDQFIPQLWRWIRDGEWQNPPVMRKPPERKLFGQEAVRDVIERYRARIS
jgi:hypothetical protein